MSYFNLIDLIRIFWKWKKWILGFTFLSAVLIVPISLFLMDDYYKSTAVFYPINLSSSEGATIFGRQTEEINYYGDKHDVNRLLSFANASPLISYTIYNYKLYDHYDIDTLKKHWFFKTRKKFLQNYNAFRTDRDGIEISLLDKDPLLAATIVNDIVQKIDEKNKTPVQQRRKATRDGLARQVKKQEHDIDSIVEYLLDIEKRHNIRASVFPDGTISVHGKDKKAIFDYQHAWHTKEKVQDELKEVSKTLSKYEVSARDNHPSIVIVEKAYASDRKEKPVRSVICLLVVCMSFIIATLIAIVIEQVKVAGEMMNRTHTNV